MLKLVRDKTRSDPDGWPDDWTKAQQDDETDRARVSADSSRDRRDRDRRERDDRDGYQRDGYERDRDGRDGSDRDSRDRDVRPPAGRDTARRRQRKPSIVGRIALTILMGVTLGGLAAGAWIAVRAGALETIFAGVATSESAVPTPETVSAVASPSAPQPLPTPPAEQPAAAGQAAVPPMPDPPTVLILIRNSIVALHQATVTGNYVILREIGAPAFQKDNDPATLSASFADLGSRHLDLDRISVVVPRLKADPVIDKAGLLRLAGFFQAGAEQVDFDLVFQMAGGRWRMFAIGVFPAKLPEGAAAAKPAPTAVAGKLPDDATMASLIRGTVIALNQANITGNYSVLRDSAAPGFREGNDLAKLAAAFGELRARQMDLSPVAVIEPKLFRPPALDKNGYLRLTGFFPSHPEQVNFDLAYQVVDGQWRLFGIGLNTSREVPAAAAAEGEPPAATEAPTASAAKPVRNVSPGTTNETAAAPATAPAPKATAVAPVPRLRPR